MTNLSELTRREQVLARLQEANGSWVDGSELSSAECGGSEGLKRVRELRRELKTSGRGDILMRQKPDSDQYQYRLVTLKAAGPALVDESITVTSGPAIYTHRDPLTGRILEPIDIARHEFEPYSGTEWGFCDRCNKVPDAPGAHFLPVRRPDAPVEPPERYERPQQPVQTAPEAPSVHLGKTASGEFVVVNDTPPPVLPEDVPPPPEKGQTSLGVPEEPWTKFKTKPTHLDMGSMRLCPTCKGYRRPIHETDKDGNVIRYPTGAKGAMKPRVLAYEDFCRDPRKGHQDEECERCNGFGVIPA